MLLKLSIFFIVMIGLLSSCNKEKEVSTEQLIKRKWTLSSSESKDEGASQFLTLIDKDDKKTFYTNIKALPDTTGEWSILKDSILILTGAPIFEVKEIDSTVIIGEDDKATIVYFNGGRKIGELKENVLTPTRSAISLTISKLDDESLILENGKKIAFEFEYVPNVIENQFSIISILRGLLGLFALLSIAWLCSANRKAVNWTLVLKGVSIQIILAIALLKVPFIANIFEFISQQFIVIIGFTQEGTNFLLGSFIEKGAVDNAYINFAFKVLPTIIFFSALTSLFYYWGILQIIVKFFAKIMQKIMGLSGSESMAAAGNVFLGQTEAPLLIKPYLLGMTKSEFMTLMTGGMATIAGGVLAGYISFLGDGDPAQELFFAKHLLIASIMSAPAAIVAAKILVPETEKFNTDLSVPKEKLGTNALEAIANGTTDGIKLAVNVAGMLLVFIALVAFGNYILEMFGEIIGVNDWIAKNTEYKTLSFDLLIGYAGAPIVWLMGVPNGDIVYVGELLGKKTVINEFVGYMRLGEMKSQGMLSDKAILMSTYLLCGFANFASIGIQIGGIGALVPSRKGLLSKLGVRALIGGTIACLMTAVVVGMMM